MKYLKLFLFYLLQWTWGFLQNFVGLLYVLKCGKLEREWFHGSLITYHKGDWGGISLGMFIIMNGTRPEKWIEDARIHEYGHSIQSLILGPLYFPVIAIPSSIWCNVKKFIDRRNNEGISYYAFYPEWTANALGAATTKLPKPTWADDIATARRAEMEKEKQITD